MRDDKNIMQAMEISRQLMQMADKGAQDSEDDGCIIFFGIVRDCAYKIQNAAEREMHAHKSREEGFAGSRFAGR